MKTSFKNTILVVLIIMILLSLSSCNLSNSAGEPAENAFITSPKGEFIHIVDSNYYIQKTGRATHALMDMNENIILSGTFYSYSIIENRCIAIHYMYLQRDSSKEIRNISYDSGTFSVVEDNYIVFDFSTGNISYFDNINDFNSECLNSKLVFEKWYYNGHVCKNTELTLNSYIRDLGSYRGQILFIDNKPILEGIIDEYSVIDSHTLAVAFKDGELDFGKEFSEANKCLPKKDFKTNKWHRLFGVVYKKMNYSAYLIIDTDSGSVSEFSKKKELEEKMGKRIEWVNT